MDLIEIARLEEARQARGLSEVAPETRPFAGGMAGRAAPGVWFNAAVGMALVPGASVSREEIQSLIDWYESRGIEARMEVSPFVPMSFLADIASMGFRLHSFESVLYREIAPGEPVAPVHAVARGIEVRPLDITNESHVLAAARLISQQFYPPRYLLREEDCAAFISCARHPRTVCMLAWLDDQIIGGGSMEVVQPEPDSPIMCALFGLGVHPDYRRRGVQQAIIAARLNLAISRGATLATVGSRPGIPTERNVRRMGFSMAYTKVVMVKPGPGLAPIVG